MTDPKYLPKFDVYHNKMRLIAAAPELLAMLETVLDFANESGLPCDLEMEPEFIAARALIAKAKGESDD